MAAAIFTFWMTCGLIGSASWNLIESSYWRWGTLPEKVWWAFYPVLMGPLSVAIVLIDLGQKFGDLDDDD